jgi:N-acetylglucosamine-6-sulfatase
MDKPITRKDTLKLGLAAGTVAALGVQRKAMAAPVGLGSRPNILLIVVDDMPDRLLTVMNTVQTRLVAQGTRFLNAYTGTPLCGPNRAVILTGLFPHNTGVLTNSAWKTFRDRGHENFTPFTALNAAGYDTALVGKYMNGRSRTSMRNVPPGFDRGFDNWYELSGAHDVGTSWWVSDNGTIRDFPASVNESQHSAEKARDWILSRQPATRPFVIQWSPTNPHQPFDPTAVHAHLYDDEPPRNAPSVNEADMSDKPAKMQKGLVGRAKMEEAEEGMREELEDTDDQVNMLLNAAEQVTGNSNLLVIFTSDNGYQVGEHRVFHKSWQYQESIEIPFLVRGTGLPAQTSDLLVSSTDIFQTILRYAGVADPRAVDGRALNDILAGTAPTTWRKRVLIENPVVKKWQAYREYQPSLGKDFVFIRHLDDSDEFYNLATDEFQLESKPGLITADMHSKLDRLTRLNADNLRAVEQEA